MDDLTAIVPTNLLDRARRSGNELVFQHPDALEVVSAATEHGVAVLGVEVFQVEAGLQVEDYSGYEFPCSDDWQEFVRANNTAALEFICGHSSVEERGYILTAVSEREFRQLK